MGDGPGVETTQVRARSSQIWINRTPERTSKRRGYEYPRVGYDREAKYSSRRWMQMLDGHDLQGHGMSATIMSKTKATYGYQTQNDGWDIECSLEAIQISTKESQIPGFAQVYRGKYEARSVQSALKRTVWTLSVLNQTTVEGRSTRNSAGDACSPCQCGPRSKSATGTSP